MEVMENENLFRMEEDQESQNNEGPKSTLDIVPVKKRIVRNPLPKLNPERIMGPKGLEKLEDTFSDFSFKGEGREAEDLDEMMRRFTHWAHVLFPQLPFRDVTSRISQLGKKKEVQVNLKRIRLGMKTTFHSRIDADQDDVPESAMPPQEEGNDDMEDDQFQRLILQAEAEDDAREAREVLESNQDEIISLINQAQNINKEGIQSDEVLNDDIIPDDILRKYDSSSSDDEEGNNALLSSNSVVRQKTKESDSDEESVVMSSVTNIKKRNLSEDDSDEDVEDGLVKRKRVGKVLESSDEE